MVRARHLQYQLGTTSSNPANWPQETLSDLARIRRDHEFLRVLSTAMNKQGLGNPITDARLIGAVAPSLTTDSGLSTRDMINMVLQFRNVNANTAPQYTLPVMTSNSYSYYYKGGNYGNVAFPINVPDLATIQAFLGQPTYFDTMQGKIMPKLNDVTVSVLDGSGSGDAQATADALHAVGFQIGLVGSSTPVGNPAETVVAYNSLNPEVVSGAQAVWHELSGQTILAYEPTNTAPITVVTGTNFAVYPPTLPAPATTTTTHKTTSTAKASKATTTTAATTTTTAPVTVPGFQAPNNSTSSLQPWDPRSCTASGGEGP